MDRELDSSVLRARVFKLLTRALLTAFLLSLLVLVFRDFITLKVELNDYRVATVETGEVSTTVTASGVVVPKYERLIASPINSRISAVHTNLGAKVLKGELILELDSTQIELQIASLEDQSELKTVEEQVLAQQHKENLSEFESRKELLSIDLESYKLKEQQYRTLYGQGSVSLFDLTDREITVRKAVIELRQIDERLADLQVSVANQLQRLQLEKNILRQQLQEQQRLKSESQVRATRDGVITSLLDQPGQSVTVGVELVRIADLSSFRIEGRISDFYRTQFYEGLPVIISIGQRKLQGILTRILPTVDDTGVITMQVDFQNNHVGELQPNMRVGLEIVTQQVENGLRVINGVAFNGSGQQTIFVIEEDSVQKRNVQVGMINTGYVEILAGLNPGEKIIISDMSNYMHMEEVAIR